MNTHTTTTMTFTSMPHQNTLLRNWLFAAGYVLIFFAAQFFLYQSSFVATYPTPRNLVSWDAGWYQLIAQHGYVHSTTGQSNTGFYYLFPLIWKLVGLNTVAIVIVNVLLFTLGMSILANMYQWSVLEQILFISMPQMVLAFVPYSEALFFLLATTLLLSLEKGYTRGIWLSLFLLSLTRATAITLAPALLLLQLLSRDREHWLQSIYAFIKYDLTALFAGLGVFVLIQYYYTGVWFAYFDAQRNFWMRKFATPIFPLHVADYGTLWLNALAVFICVLAVIFACIFIVRWWRGTPRPDKAMLLSTGYLVAMLFLTLFYSPKWAENETSVIGTFRYALLTPFFLRFLTYLLRNVTIGSKQFVAMFFLSNVVWLAFGSYVHIQFFLFFLFNTVLIFLYMMYAKKIQQAALIMMCLQFVLQVSFFQQFIKHVNILD